MQGILRGIHRFPGEVSTACFELGDTFAEVVDLESETGPGARPLSPAVNPDCCAGDEDFAPNFGFHGDFSVEESVIKGQAPPPVGSPQGIFDFCDMHKKARDMARHYRCPTLRLVPDIFQRHGHTEEQEKGNRFKERGDAQGVDRRTKHACTVAGKGSTSRGITAMEKFRKTTGSWQNEELQVGCSAPGNRQCTSSGMRRSRIPHKPPGEIFCLRDPDARGLPDRRNGGGVRKDQGSSGLKVEAVGGTIDPESLGEFART